LVGWGEGKKGRDVSWMEEMVFVFVEVTD
jgi:hypothetical protein